MSISRSFEHIVTAVAGADGMHDLLFGAAVAESEVFNAGALVSLNDSMEFVAGCSDTAMPMWAVNGSADKDVEAQKYNISGGAINAYVAAGGFELFTSEFDSATGHSYKTNQFLTAATATADVGKVTESPTNYNTRAIVGQVSRGVTSDPNRNTAQQVLYFWPKDIPKVKTA